MSTTLKEDAKLPVHGTEIVSCGGVWKAWTYIGERLVESEDGHKTPEKALWQLRYRVRLAGGIAPKMHDAIIR